MSRGDALGILRAQNAELRARGVRHAALFGSVARGEARADSDLDVMIDIDRAVTRDVYDYAGIISFIADLSPTAVDVPDREALKEHVRQRVERDAVPAF